MQGVTTAVVAFIFVCLAIPSLVKNKNQYYAAVISTVAIIFFDAVAHMFPETAPAPRAVFYVLTAFTQIVAIGMLILSTGGLTLRELGGDVIEVTSPRRNGKGNHHSPERGGEAEDSCGPGGGPAPCGSR